MASCCRVKQARGKRIAWIRPKPARRGGAGMFRGCPPVTSSSFVSVCLQPSQRLSIRSQRAEHRGMAGCVVLGLQFSSAPCWSPHLSEPVFHGCNSKTRGWVPFEIAQVRHVAPAMSLMSRKGCRHHPPGAVRTRRAPDTKEAFNKCLRGYDHLHAFAPCSLHPHQWAVPG